MKESPAMGTDTWVGWYADVVLARPISRRFIIRRVQSLYPSTYGRERLRATSETLLLGDPATQVLKCVRAFPKPWILDLPQLTHHIGDLSGCIVAMRAHSTIGDVDGQAGMTPSQAQVLTSIPCSFRVNTSTRIPHLPES